jgi:hypothetical protein
MVTNGLLIGSRVDVDMIPFPLDLTRVPMGVLSIIQ